MISLVEVRRLLRGKRSLEARDVQELLDYDPDTGELTWRWRGRKWFLSEWGWPRWNTRYAGKAALAYVDVNGYRSARILNKNYRTARVIWLWVTGSWPDGQIDHVNHDRVDDRWCNLRDVTNQENGKNQSLPSNNRSGVRGVGQRENGRFVAYIYVDKRKMGLGTYDTLIEAVEVRKLAERTYGYHENHGS